MTRGSRNRISIAKPKLQSSSRKISKGKEENKNQVDKKSSESAKAQDSEITCPICLENPHNALLLLCSSHGEGCRPYMCATSYRYANCFERYKKASEKRAGLVCPLCRGQVKSWILDVPGRRMLDARKRDCMVDNCTVSGTYRDLRKHMRESHPSMEPQVVDPLRQEKWQRMEHERDWNDMLSVLSSSAQRESVVVGDYVIEFDSDGDLRQVPHAPNLFNLPHIPIPLQEVETSGNVSLDSRLRRLQQGSYHPAEQSSAGTSDTAHGQEVGSVPVIRSQSRTVLGRSGRRARRRKAKR